MSREAVDGTSTGMRQRAVRTGPGTANRGGFNHNPLLFWTKLANIEAFGAVHSDKWPYQRPGSRKKGAGIKKTRAVWGGIAGVVATLMLRIARIYLPFSSKKAWGQAKKIGVMDCTAPHGVALARIRLPTTRSAPRDGFARLPLPSPARVGPAGHRPRRRPGRLVPRRLQCALYWQLSCEM